jgi:hypothetical protein
LSYPAFTSIHDEPLFFDAIELHHIDIIRGCCKLIKTIQSWEIDMSSVTGISKQHIQQAILTLPDIEKTSLLHWFIQADKQLWDEQLEADFSTNGPGATLLEQIKE